MSGPEEFGEFYRRLKHVKEHHRRYPNDVEEPMQMEFLKLDEERVNPPEELQSESVACRAAKHHCLKHLYTSRHPIFYQQSIGEWLHAWS